MRGQQSMYESLIVDSLKRRKRSDVSDKASQNIVDRIKQHHVERRGQPLEVGLIAEEYDVLINDGSVVNPFIASAGLVRVARQEVRRQSSLEGKALSLYEWVERNINYARKPGSYRNAKETLDERTGICGEMAFLYITMARSCGLQSSYVSVSVDDKGERVNHGCAMVDTGKKGVLVDPAYHQFDVKHKRYRVRSDAEVLEMFNQWRHR